MKLRPACARFIGLFVIVAATSVIAKMNTFGYVKWGEVAFVLLVFVACYFVVGILFRVASGDLNDDDQA